MRPRQRTQFCEVQTRVLEETFKSCNYPSIEMKKVLAGQLNLPENRVTVWFQNRRAKQRRHHRKEELSRLIDNSRLVESKSYFHLAPIPTNWTSSPNESESHYPEQPTSTTQQPWSPVSKSVTQQTTNSFKEYFNFNSGSGFMFDPALNFAPSHPEHQMLENHSVLWGECDITKTLASGVVSSSSTVSTTYYTPSNYPQLGASFTASNNVKLPIPPGTAPNYPGTSEFSQVNN